MFYEPKDGKAAHGLPHDPFKAIVAPRPIAWVSSLNAEGQPNLAPYSYFQAVCDAPPIVIISCSPHPPGGTKDTRANILATEEFVIHIVPHAMREAMNLSSAPFEHGVDEFEKAGLTKAPSTLVAPPRIADAPIAMECRLHDTKEMPSWQGGEGYMVFFGEVVGIHIDEGAIRDGRLDVTTYRPVSRLGYMDYDSVDAVFEMPRPSRG